MLSDRGILEYTKYWDRRYASGGTSGTGSYGPNAIYKASVVNQFVQVNNIESVLEFGCGDGNQLAHYNLPNYVGLDVSETATTMCRERFLSDSTKSFQTITPGARIATGNADLVMSLEVLMHITKDEDLDWTLSEIFKKADRFVIIQTPLFHDPSFPAHSHERHQDIFSCVLPFLGEFALTDVVIHPSVSLQERRRGVQGEMASDFLFFARH